jgi:uncharacterized OsmC-like protein
MPTSKVDVRARQAPTRQRYLDSPDSAPQVLRGDERGERAERLLRSAERYCVVLDTLRAGVAVESTFTLETR